MAICERPPKRKRFQAKEDYLTGGRQPTIGLQSLRSHRAFGRCQMAFKHSSHSKKFRRAPLDNEPSPSEQSHQKSLLQVALLKRPENGFAQGCVDGKSRHRKRLLPRIGTPKPAWILGFLLEKRAVEVPRPPIWPHDGPSCVFGLVFYFPLIFIYYHDFLILCNFQFV